MRFWGSILIAIMVGIVPLRAQDHLIAYCEGDGAEPLNKVTLLADELLQE